MKDYEKYVGKLKCYFFVMPKCGGKHLNLEKRIIDEIIDIAYRYKYIKKIILFGSRARGDNSQKSDIDLAIYSDKSIAEFIEDIEMNTHTLLEFDFSDMNSTKDEFFIEQIKKEGIVIYEKC